MIKTILKISCLFLFFSCSNSEYNQEAEAEKVNDKYQKNCKTLNVKGNIKSIICIKYQKFIPDYSLGWLDTKDDYIFNKKGNVIEEKNYSESEKLLIRKVYEYDKMNNIIKEINYDSAVDEPYILSYFFNKQGRLLRFKDEAIGERIREALYKYVELSNDYDKYYSYERVVPSSYKPDGYYQICTYSNGKPLSSTFYTLENEIVNKYVHKYDTLGNIIEEGSCKKDDCTNLEVRKTYFYDGNGKLIKQKFMNEYERIFDQNGNVISQISNQNNTFNAKYVYDKKNNWIKRTTYLPNGKLRTILERKIEYFD